MKYIYDIFTGANGTALAAHAPDINRPGTAWAVFLGAWTIQGNKAATTSVANARVFIDSDLADGRFKVNLMTGAVNQNAYLIFRGSAFALNYWMAGLDDTTQQVLLYSSTAGALTLRAAKAFVQDEASTYEIKIIARGDDIEVYVDDVLKISFTSDLYKLQDNIGFYAATNAAARFDDLVADERATCLYCTSADVKSKLGEQWTSGTAYDEMIEDAIMEASRLMDLELGWEDCHFAASDQATITRYYDGTGGTEFQIDRFLDDAAFAVAVDDDADGIYTAWVRNRDYITWPYNSDYINRLVLATNSTVGFTIGQRSVQVTGRIGAYAEPPAVVRKAAVIMVAKAFKRGMQLYQDTGAIEQLGQLKYVLAIDPEVAEILKNTPGRAYFG
jgi:hypothetical protein